LAVGFILAAAYWVLLIADDVGVFDQLKHKSADTLIGEYQAGQRYFTDWDLSEEDLSGVNLSGAKLYGADLTGADLREADLERATVTDGQLAQAASLKGATMPDGTVHE
jgi:uncharacterized protein YjbI with pentapeptide repeats